MRRPLSRHRTVVAAAAVAALTFTAVPASGSTSDSTAASASDGGAALTSGGDRHQLRTWAADTWRSFDALVVEETGLPDDNIDGDLDPGSRGGYTSPTNIGAYLWSTVVARDLGLISRGEARGRM